MTNRYDNIKYKDPIIIEFSGPDGAGKTTALKYLSSYLKAKNYTVLESREVGCQHDKTSLALREIVLNSNPPLNGISMELIFAAMRLHNQDFYKTLKGKYDFILNDRGILCHLIYSDANVNKEFTDDFYTNFFMKMTYLPNHILYFDITPETAQTRMMIRNEKADNIEQKGIKFQQKVLDGFKRHCHNKKIQSIIDIIDANNNINSVQTQLQQWIYSKYGI